jgi:hypothetical protein
MPRVALALVLGVVALLGIFVLFMSCLLVFVVVLGLHLIDDFVGESDLDLHVVEIDGPTLFVNHCHVLHVQCLDPGELVNTDLVQKTLQVRLDLGHVLGVHCCFPVNGWFQMLGRCVRSSVWLAPPV